LLSSFSTFFFFSNYSATSEIYTLSLHDALPILGRLFSKKNTWRRIIMRFVFLIILILSLLTGCGLEEPVSKVESGVENEQKESPEQTFGVGDVVKIGETELIIKSVSFRNGDPYVP